MSHHEPDPETHLILAGPYRLFFPLGVLNGLLGVGHWALWSVGWIETSEPYFHASIQVQGFLACFVVGFLMTALPRFLGSTSSTRLELSLVLLPALGFTFFSGQYQWKPAQASFLVLLIALIPFVARRAAQRTKAPPASFLLVGFGLAHAFIGTTLVLWSDIGADSARLFSMGRQMLQVGFLLCLVMGIAGQLAPFLTGHAGEPDVDPSKTPIRGSGRGAMLFHAGTGALMLGSFVLDPHAPAVAAWMRAILVTLHLFWFGRIGRWIKTKAVHTFLFWISCWMIPVGLWSVALFPHYRLAGVHLIFIGGFSLMIFCFGLLVVMSHGARAHLLNTRLIPLQIVGGCVLLAAAFRFIADVVSWQQYKLWVHLSSGFWMVAALVWLFYVLPKLGPLTQLKVRPLKHTT